MSNVLISGGTGVIGQALAGKLTASGFDVGILSRQHGKTGSNQFYWDPRKREIDPGAIEFADHIIHLSGANIGEKRWTSRRKEELISSRVQTANLILDEVKRQNRRIHSFVSSSAIGYYGSVTGEHTFTEEDPPGNDFLAEICIQWEEAANRFKELGIRTVMIRTGVVLSRNGGALSKLVVPAKLGFGSAMGSGRQYMPWIHMDDLCSIYLKAVEDPDLSGAYNAVAPQYINNREFSRILAKVLNRPFWFPKVPAFVLKVILGKMSTIVLDGSRISPQKIVDSRFEFKYTDVNRAFEDLL